MIILCIMLLSLYGCGIFYNVYTDSQGVKRECYPGVAYFTYFDVAQAHIVSPEKEKNKKSEGIYPNDYFVLLSPDGNYKKTL